MAGPGGLRVRRGDSRDRVFVFMSAPNEIAFVVNPASASGKTGAKWPDILKRIEKTLKNYKVLMTEKPLQATTLARQALTEGSTLIVVVGGDGTLSEVINAFFENKVNIFPEAMLGCIPCGTGGDFRRSLQWDSDVDAAIQRLERRTVKVIDIGHVSFKENGAAREQYFINISSCGASGLIAKIANDMPKFMGGLLTFYTASIYGMIEYHRMALRIRRDDGEWEDLSEVNTVAVCNGAYFGGGMKVGPDADLSDGLFDVTVWTNYSILDFVTKSSAIYDGTHVRHPTTRTFKCRTLEVDLPASQPDARYAHGWRAAPSLPAAVRRARADPIVLSWPACAIRSRGRATQTREALIASQVRGGARRRGPGPPARQVDPAAGRRPSHRLIRRPACWTRAVDGIRFPLPAWDELPGSASRFLFARTETLAPPTRPT